MCSRIGVISGIRSAGVPHWGQITKRAGLRGYSQTCRLLGLATTAPLTLVTVGVDSAVAQAAAVAGDDIVGVGSAHIVRQRVNAGLLDELAINLVPVLLGEGHPSRGSLVNRCEGYGAIVGVWIAGEWPIGGGALQT